MEAQSVERMIFFARRAGAFRIAARQWPDGAETLNAAAAINSSRVAALAEHILEDARHAASPSGKFSRANGPKC
jgi:hypothetical protein